MEATSYCSIGVRARLNDGLEICCDSRCRRCGAPGCASRSRTAAFSLEKAMRMCCLTTAQLQAARRSSSQPLHCQSESETTCAIPQQGCTVANRSIHATTTQRLTGGLHVGASWPGDPSDALLRSGDPFWLSSLSTLGSTVRPCPMGVAQGPAPSEACTHNISPRQTHERLSTAACVFAETTTCLLTTITMSCPYPQP